MLSLSQKQNTFSHTPFGLAIVLIVFVLPSLAAEFNAKEFFLYFDKSCDKVEDVINDAGDDMNNLVAAALNSFNWTPLSVATFGAYWGKIYDDIDMNSRLVQLNYGKLGKAMAKKKYSLYCDGSAHSWVTTKQEGDDKGKPFNDGKGRWYIPPDRRAANLDALYFVGEKRSDYCADMDNKVIAATSVPYQPYIVLCPAAFSTGNEVKYTSLSGLKDTVQPDGTSLDAMESTGSILLHEFTHSILGTNSLPSQKEVYRQLDGRFYAKMSPASVRKNADTFSMYAKACFLEQNAWASGVAQQKTAYDTVASGSQPPAGQGSRRTVRRRRRPFDRPFYARGLDNSTITNATGTGRTSQSLTSSSINIPGSTTPTATSFTTVPSTSKVISSGHGETWSGPSSSYMSNSSTGIASSINTNGINTASITSSSSSLSTSLTSMSSRGLSSSSSSPSSTAIPGSGILPFSSDTAASTAASSIPALTWSGSWTDTTTPTPVDFTFFNIPTAVMSDHAATSEAVLLGGLFFALQADRKRLTDSKLKSQYLDDVKRTREETQALFNGLKIKPDMNDCKNTKRRRRAKTLSERQVRALLRDRGIIDGIENAIKGAVNDVSKLVSCALNVVNNLVETVKGDVPDINLIENLTDSLAEIGKDLEEEDKQESSTENPSSTTKTDKSSSSSSCTGSTVVPMCTETISLSTSFASGTNIATVGTITQTTCVTTTIVGCSGSGTTSVITASSSSASDAGEGTVEILYFGTDTSDQLTLPPESVSWLATAFRGEYTESISYNGTTAGPATSTASGIQTPVASTASSTLAMQTSIASSSSSTIPPPPSSTTLVPPAPKVLKFDMTCNDVGGTKWVARDAAIDHINTFCAEAAKQGVQDPNSGSLARTYDGNLLLSIDWPPGTPFPTDCSKFMPAIVDGCGGGAPDNPLNWKHGGFTAASNGLIRYSVTPTQSRYVHGRCKVHVREKATWHWEANRNQRIWKFWDDINVFDPHGTSIGGSGGDVYSADGDPAILKGVLYDDLKLTDEAKNSYIQFELGAQRWSSSDSPQCSVGAYDSDYTPAVSILLLRLLVYGAP